jgi:nitric oxide dioxygenase
MLLLKTLNPHQIEMLKDSWAHVLAYSEKAGNIFYPHFFSLIPEAQTLFENNIQSQDKKLISAITLMVTKISKLENIHDEVIQLAKRHLQYGVKPEYFEPFGIAFLKMLEEVMGDKWSSELADTWLYVYQVIADAMIDNMFKPQR